MTKLERKNVYKSPFMVSVNGFKYFMLTLAITLIGYFWMGHLSVKDTSYDTVRICTLIAVAIMSIEYVNFAKYSGSYVSNYALFLIAFVVFNFGLFLVFSFGGEYNFFYLKQYEVGTVLKTIQYEFGCAGKKYLISIATIILTAFLIVFIKAFREGSAFSASGLFSIFSDVLGELGSSFFPLTLIMRVCPQRHSFLYGVSYLYSILAGFIPDRRAWYEKKYCFMGNMQFCSIFLLYFCFSK